MSLKPHGELVPVGGGDTIPLTGEKMKVGRRESCDICMHFPNVSGIHCQFEFKEGYWYIRDLNSTNGVKVNGSRVQEKILHPKDEVTIAKRSYVIHYEMPTNRNAFDEFDAEEVISESLLERAGLDRRGKKRKQEEDED